MNLCRSSKSQGVTKKARHGCGSEEDRCKPSMYMAMGDMEDKQNEDDDTETEVAFEEAFMSEACGKEVRKEEMKGFQD